MNHLLWIFENIDFTLRFLFALPPGSLSESFDPFHAFMLILHASMLRFTNHLGFPSLLIICCFHCFV